MSILKNIKTKDLLFLLNRNQFNFKEGSILEKTVKIKHFPTSSSADKIKIASGAGITASALAIDILWAIVSMLATGITLTGILVGGFGIIAGLLGIVYAVNNYKKNRKEEGKNLLEFKTAYFKLMILTELVQRQKAKFAREVQDYLKKIDLALDTSDSVLTLDSLKQIHTEYLANKGLKTKLFFKYTNEISQFLKLEDDVSFTKKSLSSSFFRSRTTKVVGESLALSSVLFASFFWSSSTFMTALGFSSLAAIVSGPIGVGIALGICVVVGLVYARHVYLQNKQSSARKKLNVKMNEKVNIAQMEYELVKKDLKIIREMQSELAECSAAKDIVIPAKKMVSHRFFVPETVTDMNIRNHQDSTFEKGELRGISIN